MNRDEIAKRVGQAIKNNRTRLGLTLNAYSNLTGAKPSTIGSWERGERLIPIDELIHLADRVGETPTALLAEVFTQFEVDRPAVVRVDFDGNHVTVLGQVIGSSIKSASDPV